MKARALLLGFALVVAASSPSFAQDDEEEIDSTLTGWFVGGGVALTKDNFSDGITSSNGFGGDFTMGYRASEWLSLEIQTQFLENFHAQAEFVGQNRSEVDIWTSTLNFRLHFPMEDSRIEPYMTYGVGVMDVETTGNSPTVLRPRNNTDMVLKAGGGVAYQVDNAVSVYVAGTYALPLGNIKQFDHIAFTAGFIYKFEEEYE
jgi:opacity protein-like surface antigen